MLFEGQIEETVAGNVSRSSSRSQLQQKGGSSKIGFAKNKGTGDKYGFGNYIKG